MKKVFIFFAALAFSVVATAEVTKYKDWPKSPEAYFLTPAERADWAKLTSDAEAETFITAYYAKRGGDRFKDEIARRIAAADSQFKLRRQRGAESVRGRLLVTLGGPSRVSTSRSQEQGAITGDAGLNTRPDGGAGFGSNSPGAATQTWIYAKEKFDPSWGIGELSARINVDPARGTDELQIADAVNRAVAIVAEKSIVNPAASAGAATGASPAAAGAPAASSAPAGGSAPPAPQASAAGSAPAPAPGRPAVPAAATGPSSSGSKPAAGSASAAPAAAPAASLPAATRAQLDTLSKEKRDSSGFWGGTFRSIPGDPFFSLALSVPAEKAGGATAKFAALITGESGQEAASFFEDVPLMDMKTGNRTEKVYERSIVLPPGSYRGAFALLGPDGSTPLASGVASFQLQPKTAEFEVSPLILASTLTPLTKRPGPTDPFVFGMEKPIRVDPKGNRLFARDESLWYFYTVSNPKVAGGAAAPAAAAAAPAAPGAPAAGTAAPAADAAKPRVMARIGVLRDGQPAFAPFSGPAELQPLGADYYGTGSEIPLASFEPGYYTFTLNVRDLNAPRDSAAFKGADRKDEFIVLKPDGSLPEKKAAAPAPAARPKPAPKK